MMFYRDGLGTKFHYKSPRKSEVWKLNGTAQLLMADTRMLSALFDRKKQEYYKGKRRSLIRRWLEDGADRPVEDGADQAC